MPGFLSRFARAAALSIAVGLAPSFAYAMVGEIPAMPAQEQSGGGSSANSGGSGSSGSTGSSPGSSSGSPTPSATCEPSALLSGLLGLGTLGGWYSGRLRLTPRRRRSLSP
jgi:hypothetical protein